LPFNSVATDGGAVSVNKMDMRLFSQRQPSTTTVTATVVENPTATVVTAKQQIGLGVFICEHCGKTADKNAHNQRFCSTVCRMASWELSTGKKINLKKSS
jgi:hypothetical protein